LLLSLVLRFVTEGKSADISLDHVDLDVFHWRSWRERNRALTSRYLRRDNPSCGHCVGALDVCLQRLDEVNGLGLESVEVCCIVELKCASNDRCRLLELSKGFGNLLVQAAPPSLFSRLEQWLVCKPNCSFHSC